MGAPWEKYQASDAAPWEKYSEEPQKEPVGATAARGVGAVSSGVNRGVLRLLGLPADTVANVIDLLKAGAGTIYGETTGKSVPDALSPLDRSSLPLTGDWLEKQLAKVGGGDIIFSGANDFPKLHAVGMGVGSSLMPVKAGPGALSVPSTVSIPRTVASNAGWGGAASATGAAVGEQFNDPAAVIAASMLVPVARNGSSWAVRKTLGGDPSQTQDRIKAFQDAGVDNPSVGLATGNKFAAGIENLLANTPGSMGVMSKARERIVNGLLGKVNETRDLASSTYSPTATGNAIQRDGNLFDEAMIAGRARLYGDLERVVPNQTPTPVSNTATTLSALNADIPGAPNLSRQFKNARILSIEDALQGDLAAAGTPTQPARPPQLSIIIGPDGRPILISPGTAAVPGRPATTMPWEAVSKTRTLTGQEISDTNMASTVPRSKWNPLYGALSRDMESGVQQVGPDAVQAFNRANRFTRAGAERADLIEPIVKATTPEQAWTSVDGLAKGGLTMYQALKKSVTPETRGSIAATKIDRLGRANPGAQNDEGNVWSPETFLTRYNQMDARTRKEFFSGFPNAPQVQKDMDAIAKAASMLRDSSKVWANPSGTGQNLAARGAMATIGGSILLAPFVSGAWVAGAGTAATMVGANLAARALTNPKFVNWLAKAPEIPPGRVESHLNRLAVMANESGDPQFKLDVAAYLEALNK